MNAAKTTIRDAATLILVARNTKLNSLFDYRVLLLERGAKSAFMVGAYIPWPSNKPYFARMLFLFYCHFIPGVITGLHLLSSICVVDCVLGKISVQPHTLIVHAIF